MSENDIFNQFYNDDDDVSNMEVDTTMLTNENSNFGTGNTTTTTTNGNNVGSWSNTGVGGGHNFLYFDNNSNEHVDSTTRNNNNNNGGAKTAAATADMQLSRSRSSTVGDADYNDEEKTIAMYYNHEYETKDIRSKKIRLWFNNKRNNKNNNKNHKQRNNSSTRSSVNVPSLPPPPPPTKMPQLRFLSSSSLETVVSLGPPHLQIYKSKLPDHLLQQQPNPQQQNNIINNNNTNIFDELIEKCELYAKQQQKQSDNDDDNNYNNSGWETNMYSLTKQDIAIKNVPGAMELIHNIHIHILETIRTLYQQPILQLDQNQPHILKYHCNSDDNENNTKNNYDHNTTYSGVPLHHDSCHVTVNLMLSPSNTYTGGGTYFANLNKTIFLQQGEFLLHPGHLIHSGCNITSGTRYLLIYFVHFPTKTQPPNK